MTPQIKQLGIVLAITLIAIGALFLGKRSNNVTTINNPQLSGSTTEEQVVTPSKASSTTITPTKPTTKPSVIANVSTKGFRSYANAEHNFTIQYPSYVQPRASFATFHEIGNNWRLYPSQANQGKQITSFSIFTVDQGTAAVSGKQTYPLYFTAEVRIGVSSNTKDCYATDPGYTNQKITTVTINGTTFKKFSTSDAGMMKYVQAESYRTIHNNMCYVLEQIKNGSIYKDETMKVAITDATLTNYYATGETIITTFRFTK